MALQSGRDGVWKTILGAKQYSGIELFPLYMLAGGACMFMSFTVWKNYTDWSLQTSANANLTRPDLTNFNSSLVKLKMLEMAEKIWVWDTEDQVPTNLPSTAIVLQESKDPLPESLLDELAIPFSQHTPGTHGSD
ncbi:MAG: hypothetical protein MHM6MM_008863 [Cercozoa sp. M6MM]